MITIASYIQQFAALFPELQQEVPWELTQASELIIAKKIKTLNSDYKINNNIAIHKDAKIEEFVSMKGPIIVSEGCYVGSHAFLHHGVFLSSKVHIGPGCQIKSSLIFSNATLMHANFVGDSLLGSHVTMEAGCSIMNHYHERKDKSIFISVDGQRIPTGLDTFGALVGDHTKMGANAVLAPGTVLAPHSIIHRLQLVEQGPS